MYMRLLTAVLTRGKFVCLAQRCSQLRLVLSVRQDQTMVDTKLSVYSIHASFCRTGTVGAHYHLFWDISCVWDSLSGVNR